MLPEILQRDTHADLIAAIPIYSKKLPTFGVLQSALQIGDLGRAGRMPIEREEVVGNIKISSESL